MAKKTLYSFLAVLMLQTAVFAPRVTVAPIIKYPGRNWPVMYSTQLDKRRANDYVTLLLDCLEESLKANPDYAKFEQLRILIREYAAAVNETPLVASKGEETLPNKILMLVPYLKTRRLISRQEMFDVRDIFRAAEAAAEKSGKMMIPGQRMSDLREFIEKQFDVLLAQTAVPDVYLLFYEQLKVRKSPKVRLKLLIVLERALSWEGGRKKRTVAGILKGKTGFKLRRLPNDKPVSLEPIDTILELGLHKSKNKPIAYWTYRVLALFDNPGAWRMLEEAVEKNFDDGSIRRAVTAGLAKNPNGPVAGRLLARIMKKLHDRSTNSKTEIERSMWLSELGSVAASMVKLSPRVFRNPSQVEAVENAYKMYFKRTQIKLADLYKGIRSFIETFSQPTGVTSP